MYETENGASCVYAETPTPIMISSTPKVSTDDSRDTPGLSSQSEGKSEINIERHAADNDRSWISITGLLAASSSANFPNNVCKESSRTIPGHTNNSPGTVGPQPRAARSIASNPSIDRRVNSQKRSHSTDYVLPSRELVDSLLNLFFKHAYIQWVDRRKFMR